MIQYWFEIRRKVILCAAAYGVCFLLTFCFFDKVYALLTYPLDQERFGLLVSQGVTEPLMLPFQMASSLSWLMVVPFILQQLLTFVFPALYPSEKKVVGITAGIAVVLFYVGASFGFFLVQPLLLSYVQLWLPSGVLFLPTISSYLTFSLDMSCAFGVIFEVPVVLMVCILQGWVSVSMIRSARRWWVVGIFFVSMVVTPPDVYSQIMLALPLWLMVELVLLCAELLYDPVDDIVTSD
tara:strand:- start:68 stop:781 length:714 start_codon:yes stop_codon:yes gene_type:complete